MFLVRVSRNLVPPEVAVVAAEFKEGEPIGFCACSAQKMLDDFASFGNSTAEARFVDKTNSKFLRRERGKAFLDGFI